MAVTSALASSLVVLGLFGAHLFYWTPPDAAKQLLATIEDLRSQLDATQPQLSARGAAETAQTGQRFRRLLSVASKPVPFALGLYNNFCPSGAFRISQAGECSRVAAYYNWSYVASEPY